jgi:uncharacterized protein (TIGR03437 family)
MVCGAVLLAATQLHAQSILGSNLIVNGNAEMGAAGTGISNIVASIPGWTRAGSGTSNVLPYNVTNYLLITDPAPPDHGFQYFAGAGWPNAVTLSQVINVSAGASNISAGNVEYTFSAYLGSSNPSDYFGTAQVTAAFQNANGQTFSTATLGPLDYPGNGLSLQRQIGLAPAGTTQITVTISLLGINGGNGAADSLSLVLNTIGASPGSVLGTNLVVNGGAETGPGVALPATTLYVPGWSTANRTSAAPYGGTGWIAVTSAGPPDRGVNLFCGGGGNLSDSTMSQDIDVSPAASLTDSGQVMYQVSAWLGGLSGVGSPTLTYMFFDWSGNQLAPTATLGPASHSGASLVETYHSAALPSGTRRVHIVVDFPAGDSLADNIAFTLIAPSGPPVITPGGVVSASAFGGFANVAPGSWIEIYGSNLAPGTSGWTTANFTNGVGPTSLGGVTVSVGGAAAFIDYVSPGQIDALIPSNAATGVQELTVTTATGTSDGFGLTVNQTEPGLLAPGSFVVSGKQYVGALLPDGQTFALPTGAISGVASSPASVGDILTIYGVGFGPVTGGFTAGTLVTQQNSLTTPVEFLFGSTQAVVTYYGLAPSFTGLYQFDVTVPNVAANNAEPISITLGGVKGSQTLYIAVKN